MGNNGDEAETKSGKMTDNEKKELYENGKHRRYNLLFAVNGGAFAIAKVMTVINKNCDSQMEVLGNLSIGTLSFGMAIFTLIMGTDIWVFGCNSKNDGDWNEPPFGVAGMLVLTSICLLIIIGWLLVGGWL